MFSKGGPGKQRGFGFGGFALSNKKETSTLQPSKVLQSRSHNTKSKGINRQQGPGLTLPEKRRPPFVDSDDEDYDEKKFQDENSDEDMTTARDLYQPKSDEEEDELDVFMKGIEKEVKQEESKSEAQRAEEEKKKAQRQDIEEEDDQESYFNYIKNAPVQAYPDEEEVEIDYDSDGNPIVPEKSKKIKFNTLVHAFVTSHVDYCNSLLYGVSQYQLNRLKRVLNAAACVTCLLPWYSHITPVLFQLHWLPVASQIRFKIALLVYKALKGCAPSYITELLHIKSLGPYALRSDDQHLLLVLQTKCKTLGD